MTRPRSSLALKRQCEMQSRENFRPHGTGGAFDASVPQPRLGGQHHDPGFHGPPTFADFPGPSEPHGRGDASGRRSGLEVGREGEERTPPVPSTGRPVSPEGQPDSPAAGDSLISMTPTHLLFPKEGGSGRQVIAISE